MADRLVIPSLGDISRMALLALLSRQPMHGYELRRVIEQRHMDAWADIQPGSIYAGLQRLAHEGLLEEAGVTQIGRRPPRTTYRITSAGLAELERLIRHALSIPMRTARPVDVALSFSTSLDRSELLSLLEERAMALKSVVSSLAAIDAAAISPQRGVQARIEDIFEHGRCLAEAELRWTERVRLRVHAGDYAIRDLPETGVAAADAYEHPGPPAPASKAHSRDQDDDCCNRC